MFAFPVQPYNSVSNPLGWEGDSRNAVPSILPPNVSNPLGWEGDDVEQATNGGWYLGF